MNSKRVIAALFVFAAQSSFAAIDTYMVVMGSKGAIATESQANKIANGIEIASYSFTLPPRDIAQNILKPDRHGYVAVTMKQDLSFAQLLNEYMLRTNLGSVVFASFKSTGGGASSSAQYLTYTLKGATISNVTLASSDEAPMATLTFAFTGMSMDYSTQNASGSLVKAFSESWTMPAP
jgi:type VI protein secretion system component Hcp